MAQAAPMSLSQELLGYAASDDSTQLNPAAVLLPSPPIQLLI